MLSYVSFYFHDYQEQCRHHLNQDQDRDDLEKEYGRIYFRISVCQTWLDHVLESFFHVRLRRSVFYRTDEIRDHLIILCIEYKCSENT
jgi:hypothetical protein